MIEDGDGSDGTPTRTETFDDDAARRPGDDGHPRPGLVVVFSGERACCQVLPFVDGAVELGRDALAAAGLPDARASRHHLRVEREGSRFLIRDLGSRNGTFVDGKPAQEVRHAAPVIRIGRTLALPVADRRPFEAHPVVSRGEGVMGPSLREAHERIALVARSGANLLILGESGAGKELAALAYHAATERGARPFVAINCATLGKDLAERVLFGARKGAYTGAAADAPGLLASAEGGTLFLDEIAELDLAVQGKLLRVIEDHSVTPLGAVHPIAVDVRVCSATLKNLRVEVAAGRFREDLYFRIGRPGVRLPSLRERREEIPWLLERALSSLPGPRRVPSVELVEACLLREWPGNVRELNAEATAAAMAAAAQERELIAVTDLDDEAGRALARAPEGDAAGDEHPDTQAPLLREAVEAALLAEGGNVARAATRLLVSRSRLRRHIERYGIDLSTLRGA